MQPKPSGPRAYTHVHVRSESGNVVRAMIRFICAKCHEKLDLPNNNPVHHHGNFFANKARKEGWDTDGVRLHAVFCPTCRKTPSGRTRKEMLDSVVLPALEVLEPPTIEGHAEPMPELLPPPEKKKQEVLMPRFGDRGERAERTIEPLELTSAQRKEIRALLETHFDVDQGCYHEGMSDQEIGRIVGVPWGEVTKIRETGYGKITADPVLVSLREQLSALDAEIAEMEKHFLERMAKAEAKQMELRRSLDGYGRQLHQRKAG